MADTYTPGDRVKVHGFPFRSNSTGTVEKVDNGLVVFSVTVNMDSDRISYPFKPSQVELIAETSEAENAVQS